jgi:sterol-4alpha-carboxylate 3-dehydrogenase (decarboxylating)
MSQTKSRDVYLVIGGNGFLGRHIVQQLLDRGDIVSVFDIVERYKDVSFYSGDITDRDSVASALRKVCLNIVHYLYIPHLMSIEWGNLYHPHCVTTRYFKQPYPFLQS